MESLLLDSYHISLSGPPEDVEAKLKADIKLKLIDITKKKVAKELFSARTERIGD